MTARENREGAQKCHVKMSVTAEGIRKMHAHAAHALLKGICSKEGVLMAAGLKNAQNGKHTRHHACGNKATRKVGVG